MIHKRIFDIYLNKYPTISYVGYINSYTQSTMAIERSLIIGFSGLYTEFFIVMLTKSSVFFRSVAAMAFSFMRSEFQCTK